MGANSLESKPERLNFISPEGALTRATRLPTRSSIAITTRVLTAGRKHEPKIEGIDIADKKPIPGTRRISAKLGEVLPTASASSRNRKHKIAG